MLRCAQKIHDTDTSKNEQKIKKICLHICRLCSVWACGRGITHTHRTIYNARVYFYITCCAIKCTPRSCNSNIDNG